MKTRIFSVFLVVFWVIVLFTSIAEGQTVWKKTEISRFVPMPWRSIKIIPPDPNLPPEIQALSGRWEGRWDTSYGQESILVIEKINVNGSKMEAETIYGWGKGGSDSPGCIRAKMKIIPGPNPQLFRRSVLEYRTKDFIFALSDDKKNLYGKTFLHERLGVFKITMHKVED